MTHSSQSLRILVTDTNELAGLGSIRSLGRAGYKPVAGYAQQQMRPATSYSHWCHDTTRYPDPWIQQFSFREWLREQLSSGSYHAILPIGEAAVLATAAIRSTIPPEVLVCAPEDKHLKFTLSKFHATQAAMQAKLRVPLTVFVTDGLPGSPRNEDLSSLQFPMIFKIDNHLQPNGVYFKGSTLVAHNAREAEDILLEYRHIPAGVIVQEIVEGVGTGAFQLRWKGHTQLKFAHRRLHEVPWTGGYSSLRTSLEDETLNSQAQKLLATIGYQGVAMVEFRSSPEGNKKYFMEINGRLWGSLALALHAGLDFPAALVDCYLNDQVSPQRQVKSFQPHLRCRNTIPGEIYYLVSVLKAKTSSEGPPPPSKIKTILEFFLLTLNPTVKRDYFWLKDPLPWLIQLIRTGEEFEQKLILKLLLLAKHSSKRKLLAKQVKRHKQHLQRPCYFEQKPRRILFLCYGNICRSSFAEFYWWQLNQRHNVMTVTPTSAGFMNQSGRHIPARFMSVTNNFGVDLSEHRSKRVTRAMIDDADVVFVMDLENWQDTARAFPDVLNKTIFLGLFSDTKNPEINDPYSLAPSMARASYQHLKLSLDNLWHVTTNQHESP